MGTSSDNDIKKTSSASKGNIFYFFILTLAYLVVMQITGGKNNIVWSIIYVIIVFLTQYYMNLQLSKKLCGSEQHRTTFYNTFLPWFMIFGILLVLLHSFPGWLRPFSNTIGYSAAKFSGVEELCKKIFITSNQLTMKNSNVTNESQKSIYDSLDHIYNNPAMLINEMPMEFEDTVIDGKNVSKWSFWENMNNNNLLNDGVYVNNDLKKQLLSILRLKDNVASFCWYLMTGILTVIVSENFMVGSTCEKSVEEMEKEYDEYLAKKNTK